MSKLTARIKHEFMEILPPTIFFFVILHIVSLVRALMILGYRHLAADVYLRDHRRPDSRQIGAVC